LCRVVLCVLVLVGAVPVVRAAQPTGDPRATVETEPVLSTSDAADDAAIWPHPDDPALSLVIGTDKTAGAVEVYGMDGRRLQRISDGRANGVDLRRDFPYDGGLVDLVVVGGGDEARFYRVDPDARRLVALPVAVDHTSVRPNGVCLYRSPESGRTYLFAINLSSVVEQAEVTADDDGIEVRPVRAPFDVGSDAEACVADDDLGRLYVNEADYALWRYGAEPDDGTSRVSVDRVGDGHLTADVEGLTIVDLPGGQGYLIASSQGDDSYVVYGRTGSNPFVRKFRVDGSSTADACGNTDGIDASTADLGPGFRHGMFVCQDHHNGDPDDGNQNFKYVPLEDVVDLEGSVPTTTTTTTKPSTTTTTTKPSTTTTTAPATTTTTAPPTTTTTVTTLPPVTTTTLPAVTSTTVTTRPAPVTTTTVPVPVAPAASKSRAGYWMLGATGRVYSFGEARAYGDVSSRLPAGGEAVDLEPTRAGDGYWVVDQRGTVSAFGAARHLGNLSSATLRPGEEAVSLSATPTGNGYWVFTSRGSVSAFGDARFYGDLYGLKLNAAVLDSIPTPSGRGYFMVAADGGIFTFGDARFAGSMGDRRLNAPVQSLVPDPDGSGYWLVAADGGVFAFDAPFRGSMGDKRLNRPVTGMVPFGNGYLMVGADGGIFNFSDRPFVGSLGASPPPSPIVAVGALR
jgi:3-phytase